MISEEKVQLSHPTDMGMEGMEIMEEDTMMRTVTMHLEVIRIMEVVDQNHQLDNLQEL